MTIRATFEAVAERGSSHHVAGLVAQWNVDGRVITDAPDERLGLTEVPECTDETGHRPDRCRADALRGSGHVRCLVLAEMPEGCLAGDPEQVSDLLPIGIDHTLGWAREHGCGRAWEPEDLKAMLPGTLKRSGQRA